LLDHHQGVARLLHTQSVMALRGRQGAARLHAQVAVVGLYAQVALGRHTKGPHAQFAMGLLARGVTMLPLRTQAHEDQVGWT
jgi:hypothetical protein